MYSRSVRSASTDSWPPIITPNYILTLTFTFTLTLTSIFSSTLTQKSDDDFFGVFTIFWRRHLSATSYRVCDRGLDLDLFVDLDLVSWRPIISWVGIVSCASVSPSVHPSGSPALQSAHLTGSSHRSAAGKVTNVTAIRRRRLRGTSVFEFVGSRD